MMHGIDGSNTLSDLAGRIRASDAAMLGAERKAAEHALDIGFALLEAKEACKHGQWLPFLGRIEFSERKAQRLMQIARSGLTSDTVADLGIRMSAELAANRRLPALGEVLIIAVGHDPEGREGPHGEVTLYLAESPEHAGFVDFVGYDTIVGEAVTLKLPIRRDYERLIFEFADIFLGRRYAEMKFTRLPALGQLMPFVQKLRTIVLEDAEGADGAAAR